MLKVWSKKVLVALAAALAVASAFQTPSHCRRGGTRTGQYSVVADNEVVQPLETEEEVGRGAMTIRPFHQNWWPVATVDSLKDDRPNPIQALGQPLVTFYDHSAKQWNVLDDMCSHRFAPLSEGRVVDCSKIQCAYHGWEFTGDGVCTRLPQQPDKVGKANRVQSYPVREDLGIVWVWMDPASAADLGESIPLPVNPLVRRCYDALGPASCYMRDLPYGMEILGENLLDLSHLPFAHHSVGSLKRSLGKELPTRMLSLSERKSEARWELEYDPDSPAPLLPMAQAEILNAAAHDPVMMSMPGSNNPDVAANWTTTIGFFDPCHVRYRRWRGAPGTAGHVELFMLPTSQGRSRVFLVNCFEAILQNQEPTKPSSLVDRLGSLSPSRLKAKLFGYLIRRRIASGAGHLLAHQIFDGDGIFLHKQGNRMRRADLSFRDYSTPASSDVLLNSYRRILDAAADKTRQAGLDSMADAVIGSAEYGEDFSRAEMLDRYNSHTVHCPFCLESLRKARRKKYIIGSAKTAFQGATGSGIAATITLIALRALSSVVVHPAALVSTATASFAALAGSYLSASLENRTDKEINTYLFEDYVHADKD